MIKFNELLNVNEKEIKIIENKNKENIPWVDKYRPKKLSDIIYQKDIVNMLKDVIKTGNLPHLLLYGGSGIGKCMAKNTKILKSNGKFIKIQNIKNGEKIMGDDGKTRNVKNICKGIDILYEIKGKNHKKYIVNLSHILCLYIKKKMYGIGDNFYYDKKLTTNKTLKKYKKGEILEISVEKYLKNEEILKNNCRGFRTILLGHQNFIENSDHDLTASSTHAHHLVNQSEDLIKKKYYRYGEQIYLEKIKKINKKWKVANYFLRQNLINGFFSKNNSFSKEKKTFYLERNKLGRDLIFLMRSVGIKLKIIKKVSNYSTIGSMNYCKKKMFLIKIKTLIMSNKKINKYDTYKINIKKKNKPEEYYGFEIDGNGRYLLEDLTVTHNTSTILAIGMELFGPKKFHERVIELNASDERGINIVRNKIVTLAKSSIGTPDENYPSPPFKIIILDEADAMTTEAQSALRKTLEDHSSITRFCFIVNYINQIIEPITSRCVKFRFKPLNKDSIVNHLDKISKNEKMEMTKEAIEKISEVSNGDMRKAIMYLQNLNYLNKKITLNDIYISANLIPESTLEKILNNCLNNEQNIVKIMKLANNLIKKGYPVNNFIKQLNEKIIHSNLLDDKQKSKICIHISETEKRLLEGSDESIQLLNIMNVLKQVYLKLK